MNYLSDTTVFIAHLRGDKKDTQFLEEVSSISTVTVAELILGARDKKELKTILRLVSKFSEESISLRVQKKALEILTDFSVSHRIKFMDALIAATALNNKSVLTTDNVKHFRFIPGLEVLSHSETFKNY